MSLLRVLIAARSARPLKLRECDMGLIFIFFNNWVIFSKNGIFGGDEWAVKISLHAHKVAAHHHHNTQKFD